MFKFGTTTKSDGSKKQSDVFSTLPSDYLLLQTTVQDFLPFEDIQDSMICLKDGEYRMVIEVSSMNYYLKTAEEQETIEAMFKSAISSWDFPFSFYTQTRSLDSDAIERTLRSDIDKCIGNELRLYGEQYIREMMQINKGKTATLIKKNYVIIECNDAKLIESNHTEEDLRNYAFDKLALNVKKVSEGLSPMGLSCKVLNNEELVNLLYIAINKHSSFNMNDLLNHMSDTVFPEVEWNVATVSQIFDSFENQLKSLLWKSHNISGSEIERAQTILEKIEQLKHEEIDSSDEYFDL